MDEIEVSAIGSARTAQEAPHGHGRRTLAALAFVILLIAAYAYWHGSYGSAPPCSARQSAGALVFGPEYATMHYANGTQAQQELVQGGEFLSLLTANSPISVAASCGSLRLQGDVAAYSMSARDFHNNTVVIPDQDNLSIAGGALRGFPEYAVLSGGDGHPAFGIARVYANSTGLSIRKEGTVYYVVGGTYRVYVAYFAARSRLGPSAGSMARYNDTRFPAWLRQSLSRFGYAVPSAAASNRTWWYLGYIDTTAAPPDGIAAQPNWP